MAYGLVAAYCLLILLASLAGGWIPLLVTLTHRRIQLLLSFVAGVMLGAALLNLLPEAILQQAAWHDGPASAGLPAGHGWLEPVAWWLLAGFLSMFFIERFFCFHHHDELAQSPEHRTSNQADHRHELTWAGAALGLSAHSLMAGAALGASVAASGPADESGPWLAGLGVFLAILLHKPFDSMTLGVLMAAGGRSRPARHLVNGAFGLLVPLGALLYIFGVTGDGASHVVAGVLAFSAGTFVCISLSDLLPELQFHRHDRVKLSVALLLGLAVAWGAGRLETF